MNKSLARKKIARLAAIQSLYGLEISDDISDTSSFYEDEELKPDPKFLKILLDGACANDKYITEKLAEYLSEGWNLERIGALLRATLKIAAFEIIYLDTPKKVAINEYTNITSSFFDEKEVSFVNGLLDKLSTTQ